MDPVADMAGSKDDRRLVVMDARYSRFFLDGDKLPAAYYVLQQQRRCRIILGTLIDLYKKPDDEAAKRRQSKPVWVLPMSKDRSTEEILKGGREDIIADLSAKKLWPLPQSTTATRLLRGRQAQREHRRKLAKEESTILSY